MKREIPVMIKALVPTPTGCGVFLTDGAKVIAIFVDHSVAAAITMAMHDVQKPRPLTHDLIQNILAGLGVVLQKVVINDLKEDTYFARLFMYQELESGKNMLEIDARPSDSIALALQLKAPIYIAEDVLNRADDMGWALEKKSSDEET
ncbi:MAG TPA: bifunctional nuclease family protein [Kiritimatiellia bacterium]|nr:bifunctional nuclease family protein [Kiritimatiellia bacterium]HMO97995.1 bifunctional nuclease family protein [Kiritimatiellia bacterium]HMP95346.1 bifunctional nuclease family protein [Kiritimatiellia bacterium]